MDMERVKALVMERQGCNEAVAQRAAEKLAALRPELRPILDRWMEDPEIGDDRMYSGYSLNVLKDDWGMAFTGALLTLDWLLREPEIAAAALAAGVR